MKLLLFGILLFFTLELFAQIKYSELPIHFTQFNNNPYQNLALNGIRGTEFGLLARQNFGNFGNISTQNFYGFFDFDKSANASNSLGFIIYNDKEGDYIRTNRFYGSFVRHQLIAENWKISLGLSFGAYLFRVKFNTVTGGISETAIDGSGSLFVTNKNLKLGITLNQFLNSKLNSSSSDLKLTRFLILTANQTLAVTQQSKVEIGGYYKPIKLNSNDIFYLGFLANLHYRQFGIGSTFDVENGFSINGIIKKMKLSNAQKIDFQLSYFFPFKNNLRQQISMLEVSLRYFLEKNK